LHRWQNSKRNWREKKNVSNLPRSSAIYYIIRMTNKWKRQRGIFNVVPWECIKKCIVWVNGLWTIVFAKSKLYTLFFFTPFEGTFHTIVSHFWCLYVQHKTECSFFEERIAIYIKRILVKQKYIKNGQSDKQKKNWKTYKI
jgi:hypothetical protein